MNTIAFEPDANQKTEIHLGASPLVVKEILAATDFSEEATLAVKVAARLAKQFGCKLHVLHAVAPQVFVSGVTPRIERLDVENGQKRLHEYCARIAQLRLTKHDEVVLPEPATEAIAAIAEQKRVDLVVVGSSGRSGVGKLVLGSVAEAAIRGLHCPVLVVGPNCLVRHGTLEAIVAATSLPMGSLRAAQYAMSIAQGFRASLTLVHVLAKDRAQQEIANEKLSAARMLRELVPADIELGEHIRFEVATGDRAEGILQSASRNKAGLIVMGVREHAILAHHAPWTTLSEVIRNAHCPVLAVQSHLE
jgi:nucleotide-binding universal stress UspA family protein